MFVQLCPLQIPLSLSTASNNLTFKFLDVPPQRSTCKCIKDINFQTYQWTHFIHYQYQALFTPKMNKKEQEAHSLNIHWR